MCMAKELGEFSGLSCHDLSHNMLTPHLIDFTSLTSIVLYNLTYVSFLENPRFLCYKSTSQSHFWILRSKILGGKDPSCRYTHVVCCEVLLCWQDQLTCFLWSQMTSFLHCCTLKACPKLTTGSWSFSKICFVLCNVLNEKGCYCFVCGQDVS